MLFQHYLHFMKLTYNFETSEGVVYFTPTYIALALSQFFIPGVIRVGSKGPALKKASKIRSGKVGKGQMVD